WVQPGFYFLIAKLLALFGIDDPFTLATVFRLVSSLIGWVSIIFLSLLGFVLFKTETERKWLVRLLALTYFIPYIHARPSSEGLSASFFCIGCSMLLINSFFEKKGASDKRFNSWLVGLILGAAFLFR